MNNNAKVTARVQASSGLTKEQAEKAVATTLLSIKELTQEDGKVTIQGFGTFSIKERAARTARNPKTGESIDVPAKEVFVFKASK